MKPAVIAKKLNCGTMRILIAEDEDRLAELLERYMEPLSSYICVVKSITALFETLQREQFDLITYDLRYPDSPVKEESLARIREVKELNPEGIIIVVTGYYDPTMERLLTESCADGIIKKGEAMSSPDKFIAAIRDIVESIQEQPAHMTRVSTLEKAACRISEYYRTHAIA